VSEEQGKPDTRGTIRDWPAWVVLAGVVTWVGIVANGQKPTLVLFAVIAFGGVAWIVRAGKFSPRR
jgi:hypothetical protein